MGRLIDGVYFEDDEIRVLGGSEIQEYNWHDRKREELTPGGLSYDGPDRDSGPPAPQPPFQPRDRGGDNSPPIIPNDPFAGYNAQEREWLSRNRNADGSYDTHRVKEALSNKTFSQGGTGGDADRNGDGKADAGWTQNAGGQWVRTGGANNPTPSPSPLPPGTWNATATPGVVVNPSTGQQINLATMSSVGSAPAPIKPFTEQFSYADFVAPTPRAQDYPSYRPTTQDDLQADPSWKIRLKEAQDAIERSAAARGSYLTPNTMQDITRSSQDYASNEFGNVDNRRFRDWGTGYDRLVGEDMSAFDRAATGYGMNRGNQKDIFDTRRSIFEANENNRYGSERSNRLDDFGILTGNRNYGLGSRGLDLQSRGLDLQALAGDRGYDLGLRGADLANRQFTFGSDLANRGFDFSRDQDAWMRNRTGYRDDFDMWNTRDRNRAEDLYRLAVLGRPT